MVSAAPPDPNACEYLRYQLSTDGNVYLEGTKQFPGHAFLAQIWVPVQQAGDLTEAHLVWAETLPPLIPGYLMNKYNFPRYSLGHGPSYAAPLDTQDYMLWHADNAHSNQCGTLRLHGYYTNNNASLLPTEVGVTLDAGALEQQLISLGYVYDQVAQGYVRITLDWIAAQMIDGSPEP